MTDDPKIERPFFINGGSIYLSCRTVENKYYFANGFTGTPRFQENVEGFTPRKLQIRDGQPVDIVGMPTREAIEAAPVLQAKELYTLLDTHIWKYIDAPNIDRELFVYYILFTWFYPKVNTCPYLRFLADTGNGKSRMQRVIGDLCFYPIRAGGASTPAGVMRIKERWHGTLLIDEADLRASDATNELTKYLNLGFEKGQYFIKSDKDQPKEQDIFDPYCPKVIAMRRPFQDNATEGRLLSFTPKETTRTDIPFVLPGSYNNEVEQLRGIITRFVLANWEKVDGEKGIDIRDMPIEPRLKQIAIPLSIILQLFPDGEIRFREYLKERQKEVRKIRAASLEGMVFNAVLEWVQDQPDIKGHLTAKDIYERAGLKSPNAASRILHSIGFVTEIVKDGKTIRVMAVPDQKTWDAIIQRYYYSETDERKDCPVQLKGSRWVTQVTQVTLLEDELNSKNNSAPEAPHAL